MHDVDAHALAARLRSEADLDAAEREVVASVLEALAAGDRVARRRRRDNLLRACAATCWPRLSTRARADALSAEVRRYAATCWPRDRALAACPPRYAGTPREYLYEIFALYEDIMVRSPRQLFEILA